MERQCLKPPPDQHLKDISDPFDFKTYDDEDHDPDYVPESDTDSDSDIADSFIPVGSVTYNNFSTESSSTSCPLSPVIPLPDSQDDTPDSIYFSQERAQKAHLTQTTYNPSNDLPTESSSTSCPLSPMIPPPNSQDETPDSIHFSQEPAQKAPLTQGKARKQDKKHFCLFCGKGVTKLKRHLLSFHENEPEMFCFMAASGKSKECELKKLRHAGDHLHNIDILKKGGGEIVVKRNLNRETTKDDFVPCPRCLGYFLKRDLWRHKCPNITVDENIPSKKLVKQGRLILPNTDKDGIGEIFESLRKDNISIIIKNDETIRMIGQREFKRNGHDNDRHAHIRNKMRELGRLLLKLRERSRKPSASLKEFISPGHFQDVLDATKELAGYSLETKTYNIPALALKLGHSLQRCSILLKAKAIESKDFQTKADCAAFEELITIKWNEEISSQASRTIYQNKKNCANAIPLSEDIAALSKYLQEESQRTQTYLEDQAGGIRNAINIQPHETKKCWARLAEITLTTVILFNRRRQGEASKMKVSDYVKGLEAHNHSEDVLDGLSNFEKALCKQLKRIEITGKRGRLVPVILTDNMKNSMDLLLDKRNDAGISPDNTYFFARTNNLSPGHFRGSDCLRKMTDEVPLKHPHLIRSTFLRKQIAMLTQLVNLKDNELDVIAQYMGHDIRVHREHYRLPSGTVQVAKVAKLLMALDKGKVPTSNELNDDTLEYDDDPDLDDVSSEDDNEASPSELDTPPIVPSQNRPVPRRISPVPSTSSLSISERHVTAQRDMSGRRRWTADEEEACIRGFRRQIAVGHLPGKAEIMKVMQQEPALQDRTWIQVKNFVRNRLKKSQ